MIATSRYPDQANLGKLITWAQANEACFCYGATDPVTHANAGSQVRCVPATIFFSG